MNILKIGILPKATYRFRCNPYQYSNDIFTEIETTTQKFEWNHKRPQVTKAILRKKNKVGGIMFPVPNLHCKPMVITWICYPCENRHMEQNKNKEINLCSQLIYHKGAKNNGERMVSNKWCYENWTVTYKKKKKLNSTLHCTLKSTQNEYKMWTKPYNHKTPRRKSRE